MNEPETRVEPIVIGSTGFCDLFEGLFVSGSLDRGRRR